MLRIKTLNKYFFLLIIMLMAVFIPVAADAANLGNNISISTSRYDQQNPHVIFLPDKNLYFVVWEDWANYLTTGADIWGRFIKDDGKLCGSAFVISKAAGNQTVPQAAYRFTEGIDDDKIIVVWQDTRFVKTDGGGAANNKGFIYYKAINVSSIDVNDNCPRISFQRDMEKAVPFEDDDPLSSGIQSKVNSRKLPKVRYDSVRDRFLMVWVESRTTLKTNKFRPFPLNSAEPAWVFGDDQFVGYAALPAALTTGYSIVPTIISQRMDNLSVNRDVYTRARLLSRSGIIGASPEFKRVSVYEFFDEITNADISCDTTTAECMFIWEGIKGKFTRTDVCTDVPSDEKDGVCDANDSVGGESKIEYDPSNKEIFGIFEKNIPLSVVNSMRVSNSRTGAYYPTIDFDPITKRFLVAWEDTRICLSGLTPPCSPPDREINSSPNTKIFGQHVLSGSGLYNKNFIISYQDTDKDGMQDANVASSKQTKPFVSYDGVNQRYFVAWQDGRNTTNSLENLDIFGQKIDAEGTLRGNNYAIVTNQFNQYYPTIAYNNVNNQFFAVWKDARNTDKYTKSLTKCDNSKSNETGAKPCGSDVFGQRFTLGQPSLTLLNPDNTPLAPAILDDFENPLGSGSVEVGLFDTQSFKIRNTGDTTLKIDFIRTNLDCNDTSKQIGTGNGVKKTYSAIIEPTPLIKKNVRVSDGTQICTDNGGGVFTGDCSAGSINYDTGELSVTFVNAPAGGSKIVVISRTFSPFSFDGLPFELNVRDGNTLNLAPSSELRLTARFSPLRAGSYNRCFVIESDGGNRQVNLSGLALEPDISVNPASYNFGSVYVGNYQDKTFTVRNLGLSSLLIESLNNPSTPFSIQSDECAGKGISSGSSCKIVVRFSPTGTGAFSSKFGINSNDPDKPTMDISISGTGITPPPLPDITVNPLSVTFGNAVIGQSVQQTVTIRNDGNAVLTINSVSGPNSPFSIVSNNCLSSLASGSSCQISVKFEPVSVGPFSSSMVISSNDLDEETVTVSMAGNGILPSVITVTPISIDFGFVNVGSSASSDINVKNTGGSALTVSGVSNPSTPFHVTNNTCTGQTLQPDQTCGITVTFSPQFRQKYSGSLTISSNDPVRPNVSVSLKGSTPPL